MATNITIRLDDQPGALAGLGEAFGRAGVNLEGLCAMTAGGEGTIHLLVDDADAAREVLADSGTDVREERNVVVVDCPDTPGALGQRARALADAGLNIELAYLASRTRLVFGTDDDARAAEVLG